MSGIQYGGRAGFDPSGTAIYIAVELPSLLKRPSAGNAAYRAACLLRNGMGKMEAPDAATLYCRLLKSDGTVLSSRLFSDNALAAALAASASASFASGSGWLQQATAVSTGFFEVFVQVASADTEQDLTLEVGWIENGTASQDVKRFRIGDAADLDTVAVDAAAAAGAVADIAALTADVAALDAKIGTPANVSVSFDIADVKGVADALSVSVADVLTVVGTPAGATVSADIAALKATADLLATAANLAIAAADALASKNAAVAAQTVVESGVHGNAALKTIIDTLATSAELPAILGAANSASSGAQASQAVLEDVVYGNAALKTLIDLLATAAALTALDAKAGTSADASTADTILGLMGQPIGAATGDNSEGSMFSKFRHIQSAIGVNGAAYTALNLQAKLGQAADAAVANDGSNGSLYSKLRSISDNLGTPSNGATVADDTSQLTAALFIESGMLDGVFTHTTTIIECSTLHATLDFVTGQRIVVQYNTEGAGGRPRRTARTVASYDIANKRLTLDPALPWTPVNGDSFTIMPAL